MIQYLYIYSDYGGGGGGATYEKKKKKKGNATS